jgi:hypothetical protein
MVRWREAVYTAAFRGGDEGVAAVGDVLQLEEGKGKVRHEPSGEEKAAALHMKGWGGWRRCFT